MDTIPPCLRVLVTTPSTPPMSTLTLALDVSRKPGATVDRWSEEKSTSVVRRETGHRCSFIYIALVSAIENDAKAAEWVNGLDAGLYVRGSPPPDLGTDQMPDRQNG
ncbi:hypothetical protein VNO80_33238 [Phaseolus coccineus]|uniref:Uncharacterized protein n=1 Tax=Phaseolus coccineus TaxID=3886 RepID=A0AAN9QCI3_PHACN